MENTFPVAPCGSVTLSKEGCYTVIRYAGEIQNKVCRLWLRRSDGSCVSIGIPAPKGGQLELSRRYTRAELDNLGGEVSGRWFLLPAGEAPQEEAPEPKPEPEPAAIIPELVSAFSAAAQENDWRDEASPWTLFEDEDLQAAFRSVKSAMRRDDGDITELAVPFSPGEPFPVLPIFCFGECRQVRGRSCVVFTAANGQPVL